MTKSIETLGRCLASEIHAIFAQYRYSLSRQTLDLTPLLRNLGSKYNKAMLNFFNINRRDLAIYVIRGTTRRK